MRSSARSAARRSEPIRRLSQPVDGASSTECAAPRTSRDDSDDPAAPRRAPTRAMIQRVIAGTTGGGGSAPRGATRPTSERVREALFACSASCEGAVVLDLFAGSARSRSRRSRAGAAARGVRRARRRALEALRENLAGSASVEEAEVRRGEALPPCAPSEPLKHTIFSSFDPPYAMRGCWGASSWRAGALLAAGARSWRAIDRRDATARRSSIPPHYRAASARYGDTLDPAIHQSRDDRDVSKSIVVSPGPMTRSQTATSM